jgi:hypothetical protein
MVAAAIISLSSIVAVALTFYGWWELGRQVSLSPLKIAKAFDAPLLRFVGSNIGLHHSKILGPAGMQRVQYGEKANEEDGESANTDSKKLIMGLLGNAEKPTKGEMYGI